MNFVKIFSTGGTIDKIYFDASSEYEVGEPQIEVVFREARVSFDYEVTSLMRKDSLEISGEERERIRAAVEAMISAHPYEEPVIQLVEATRTRHVPGQDEGNPNRFWNRSDTEMPEWVPAAHRRSTRT